MLSKYRKLEQAVDIATGDNSNKSPVSGRRLLYTLNQIADTSDCVNKPRANAIAENEQVQTKLLNCNEKTLVYGVKC